MVSFQFQIAADRSGRIHSIFLADCYDLAKFDIITSCRQGAVVFASYWSLKGIGDDVTKITKRVGLDKPGIPTVHKKPHLGDLLLAKFGKRLSAGFDDLKRFQLIDRLEKPVLNFCFYGNKRTIIEVYDFLSQFAYSFVIRTKKGLDLWNLPEKGVRTAHVHISRFPKLIEFIRHNEDLISDDLWGLLYGYPLSEIHQFTYDWEAWAKEKKLKPLK